MIKDGLKLYQVSYDDVTITALAESKEDLFTLLQESDPKFIIIKRKLKYKNTENEQDCWINELPFERGIIQL